MYRPNQNVRESTLGLMLLMSKEMSDDEPEYFCQRATNFVELLTSISNKYIMSKKVNSRRSSFRRSKLWDLKVNDDVKYVICYKSDERLSNVCLEDEIVLTSEKESDVSFRLCYVVNVKRDTVDLNKFDKWEGICFLVY